MNEEAQIKTLGDVLIDLWRAKLYIAGFGVAGFFTAMVFMLVSVPSYRAEIIVSPANPIQGAEVSSLLANDDFFALRYLVQRVGVSNSSDFMRFETTYAGPQVAAVLLGDPQVRRGLEADRSFVFSGPDTRWNAARLSQYIARRVRLEPVGQGPMRKLVYLHPDAGFAVYFLSRIQSAGDALIRKGIREDAGQRIAYLQEAIDSTNNPEHRKALTALLMEQERLRMLVSIDQSYAASVIEPASASYKSVWPDKILVVAGFVFAFALSGFITHTMRAETKIPQGKKRKIWFRTDSGNSNERPLSARDAAE